MKSYSIWGRIVLTGMILMGTFVIDYMGSASSATAVESTPLPAAPTISLSPTSGDAGTRVMVTGAGFPAHTPIGIYLGPPNAGALPNPYGEAVTDGAGNFNTIVAMPANWPDGRAIGGGTLVILAATNDFTVKATADFQYTAATARSTSSGVVAAAQPSITVTPDSGGPGTYITVAGKNFPAGEVIRFFLTVPQDDEGTDRQVSDRPANPTLVIVQADGSFTANFILPLAWPNGRRIVGPRAQRLRIIAANQDFSSKAGADFTFEPETGVKPYLNHEGGFALRLPQGWTVSRPRQSKASPFGSMVLLGPAPLVEGDLGNSFIIVADLAAMPLERAVERLCGGCAQPPELEETWINGWPAHRATIGTEGWPALEWTFIEHDGKLIALSIHDPVTLNPLHDVIETIRFVPNMEQSA